MKPIHVASALASAVAVAGVVSAIVVLGPDRGASPIASPAPTTAPPTSEPPASSAPPVTRPTFPPIAKHLTHGEGIWAVYLAITRDQRDPAHGVARQQLVAAGYPNAGGDRAAGELGCDGDAASNLVRAGFRLEPGVTYYATAIYFDTEKDATGWVDAFEPGVIGAVHATTYCMD